MMSGKLTKASLAEMKAYIEEELNRNPAPIKGVIIHYQFHISGEEEDVFQLQLLDGQAKIAGRIAPDSKAAIKYPTE